MVFEYKTFNCRDIRWYNSCYSVGTPEVEDIDIEGIEELEVNEEEDNEDLDESHENKSQHDQILNLILDIMFNTNLIELF